ncbi:MAG: methyl-accepting chemotaxis protein [Cyanobacteria bacterium J149]|nr:MAG: methyl-accepting chemotaxis protein [Cyanobacteria bacterium J149]
MSILNAKKLQSRILLGYTVPVGILALFAIVMGVSIRRTEYLATDLERANHVIDFTRDTVIHVSRMVRNTRAAALFPTNNAKYIESYQKALDRLDETIAEVHDGDIKDPEQQKNWSEMEKLAEQLKGQSEKAMGLIKSGKASSALPIIYDMEIEAFDSVKDDMLERQNTIIDEINKAEEATIFWTFTIIIVGLFGGGGLSLILANMIAKAISDDVKKAVTQITSSSAEIATTMEEQERTASLQAASVNETTTTMDELRASSHQSEEQAKSASQAANEVLQLAENGNQSVEETVATMVDLKNKVAAIADQIVRLSEQTNQIGNISALVSDLSQQTNMLALNASVEAVRAGEHGKGFAVVAEEIRKLADQSRQSAANISNLVSDIQNAINTTVMVTDEGTKTVNAGMNITESTANAFAGVLEAINNVAMNNQQIVLNIRQQGKAVEQVLEAMDSINKGAQETAAGLTQVKAGTSQLSMTARELEAMV